ncbi:MAG: L-serine ammonia-lyase, iron-sulfur-dependent subunit beta, partial [Clostridiales bacterium]|nr:L-serine ammonia-lyase, iron-sulfur-dependent subunit beta [Clostridiales bacterium]
MDTRGFEVAGPVMIGPSSSHTAGAARLSRIARQIAGSPVLKADFGLHGSFAETYKGHGSDKALVAGMLGFREDDERISKAFEEAESQGLSFSFHPTELEGFHENSVEMSLTTEEGLMTIAGSSIGGGEILIKKINGFDVEFSG